MRRSWFPLVFLAAVTLPLAFAGRLYSLDDYTRAVLLGATLVVLIPFGLYAWSLHNELTSRRERLHCFGLMSQTKNRSGVDAWNQVISLWRHFRQGERFARNAGQQPNRPGRSRYPEPETLREMRDSGADRGVSGHPRLPHIPVDAFPRAELGLPIVFHFQGRGEPPGKVSFSDLTLYPSPGNRGDRRDRMASPLILKPLMLADGQAVPLILRLATVPLSAVEVRRGDTVMQLPPKTVIRDGRLATYRDSPLAKSPAGSAIEAFLALVRDPGFVRQAGASTVAFKEVKP